MIGKLAILLLALAAAPLPVWAKCQLAKITDLTPVVRGSRIFVPGTVNGHEILFMVDSGAPTMILTGPARIYGARSQGDIGKSYGATGHNGTVERVAIDEVTIGQWRSQNLQMPAMGTIANFGDPAAIAVIGGDILSHFDVEIDLKNNLVALYQPKDCDDSNLAYWTDNYNVVDLSHFNPRDPRIQFIGKVSGQDVLMMLDTGSPVTIMSIDIARTLGVDSGEDGGEFMGINGEPMPTWLGKFSNFTLDQENISPVTLRFMKFSQRDPQSGSHIGSRTLEAGMLLGFDFIRAHHILISHSQRKFYFSYSGGAPFNTTKPKPAN